MAIIERLLVRMQLILQSSLLLCSVSSDYGGCLDNHYLCGNAKFVYLHTCAYSSYYCLSGASQHDSFPPPTSTSSQGVLSSRISSARFISWRPLPSGITSYKYYSRLCLSSRIPSRYKLQKPPLLLRIIASHRVTTSQHVGIHLLSFGYCKLGNS